MSDAFKPLIAKVADRHPLSEDEARQAFDIMMSGEATPSQIGGFLMALRVRGETVEELTGAARLRGAKGQHLEPPPPSQQTGRPRGDAPRDQLAPKAMQKSYASQSAITH